jgi:uncharacterized coiled-coil DUF342 family protein
MNKQRRAALKEVAVKLDTLRDAFSEIQEEIANIRDEEQEYYDNMPESLQDGDKGQTAQAAIDALEEAVDAFDQFDFDDVIRGLSEAEGG